MKLRLSEGVSQASASKPVISALAALVRTVTTELANGFFSIVEWQLEDGGGPWAYGDAYSLADPYLFVYANYLGMGDRGDSGRFPGIAAHRQRMIARSAVERVFAEEGLSESVSEWFREARVHTGN